MECQYEVRGESAACIRCGHTRKMPRGLRVDQLHRRCPKGGAGGRRFRRPGPRPQGPGTELKRILAELRLTEKRGCGCEGWAKRMDAWGVGGCRERAAEIASHLRQGAAKYGYAEKLVAAASAASLKRWRLLFARDPFAALVAEAIDAAEARGRPREIKTRHLLYHLWPVAETQVWRWNVEQLVRRIDQFNGRRIVSIALDDMAAPMSEVRAAFKGVEVELRERHNDLRLREGASFVELLQSVETLDPSHATFYAHGKGVSRRGQILRQVLRWSECLYTSLLDHPDDVQTALASHAMFGVHFRSEPRWQYPGSFWWFHNASVFATDAWKELQNPVSDEGLGWAVEAFPDRMFSPQECASVVPDLPDIPDRSLGLYAPELWGLPVDRTPEARARFRWENFYHAEGLTWGRRIDGRGVLDALARHGLLSGELRVLEIGPGYGRLYRAVREAGVACDWTGVDLNLTSTHELRGAFPDATWIRADCETEGALPPGPFDLAISTLTFKHLYPNFGAAAAAIRPRLALGSALAFDVPENATPDAGRWEPETDCWTRPYTREEITTLLAAAGYRAIEFGHVDHTPDHRRLFVVARP